MRCSECIRRLLSRAVVFYVIAAGILMGVADYKKATIERLNQVSHWGDYPSLLERGNTSFHERSLRMAVRYYKLVAQLVPDKDGPYAMIGYCYAKLRENGRAVHYYKRAKLKARDHFWYDYNLGILYLRNKDSAHAIEFFHNVVDQDVRLSIEASILAPMKRSSAQQRQMFFAQARDFVARIRENSYQMMIKLHFQNKEYVKAMENAAAAIKDPGIENKDTFLLYACAAAYGSEKLDDAISVCRITALEKFPQRFWGKTFLLLSLDHLQGHKVSDASLWENFLNDAHVFPVEDQVFFHPWTYYIQPGKEQYL